MASRSIAAFSALETVATVIEVVPARTFMMA
jgi:hypothetical protein